MVFSSVLFIFYFLTTLLFIYFLTPKKYRNYTLLIFSLLFYFLGEPTNILFLILSCFINYYLSVLITKYSKHKKLFLIIGLVYNITQLFYFKYTSFLITNLNSLFHTNFSLLNIALPVGISFYTFQALSYLIDVYKGKLTKAKNILEFATYLTLFPQLVAGPIVRFSDIQKDLENPEVNHHNFYLGLKRFIIGLSKKVLLANVFGELLLKLMATSVFSSWLKPICYTFQIYFDFSGYSDMAIGLGLILGLHFLENFNYPLIAKNITDFWRRWHISLSSWFKDYVYIPLGGNKTSKLKWIRNILIVWALTGLWHGASWNFIMWGLYFGIILLIEKLFIQKYLAKFKILNHLYTLIIVIISFLIFSTSSTSVIFTELKNMFFLNHIPVVDDVTLFYFKDYLGLIIVATISSTPLIKNISQKLKETKYQKFIQIGEKFLLLGLFIICLAHLVDQSFNPFLYFRF